MDNSSKFDMYDFVGEGKSMYDILSQYLPMVNGDFSTENLLNQLQYIPSETPIYQDAYETFFTEISNALHASLSSYNGIESSIINGKISPEKEEQIFNELKSVCEWCEHPQEFNTVAEYIEYSKKNIKSQDLEPLRKTILNIAMKDILKPEYLITLRASQLKTVYLPNARKAVNRIKSENKEFKQKEFQYINSILSIKDRLSEYDKFVKVYDENVKKYKNELAIALSTGAKRSGYVTEFLKENFTPEEILRYEQSGLDYALFGKMPGSALENNDMIWSVIKSKKPEVLCDIVAEYSKNGNENQRVIAISYGKFKYGAILNSELSPTITSDIIDIVGVTRVGKDGSNTYFVLMPFDNKELKCADEIKEDEQIIDFQINGKSTTLIDEKTSKGLHYVKRDKIPAVHADYFAKVALSDEVLSSAIKNNYSYTGIVSLKSGNPKISASYYTCAPDVEAARFANANFGNVGETKYANIKDYLNSTSLRAEHFKLVESVLEGKSTANTTKIIDSKNEGFEIEGE